MERIHDFLAYYSTMMYANAFFTEHLTNPEKSDCINETDFSFAADIDDLESRFSISSSIIKKIVLNHGSGKSLEDSAKNIMIGNAHFIRTRVTNNVFELIKYYLDDKFLMSGLHSLDWFQVLYLLRNNASHLDNHGLHVKFPDWKWLINPYPEVVSWNGIEIKNGQKGETIRYSDKQIIDLLDVINNYFIENESVYSRD